MPKKLLQNSLVLIVCWALVAGVGIYVTFVWQPGELQRVKDAEKVERLKRAEVAALLQEVVASEQRAQEAVRQWRSRYKTIPDTLTSPAVIGHLNDLTKDGFENFDVAYKGANRSADYSYHTHSIQGRGYFSSLYHFIWAIENGPALYRIRDLSLHHIDLIKKDRDTEAERMQIMVSFSLDLLSYFGGAETLETPKVMMASLVDEDKLSGQQPLQIPAEVLPDQHPAVNPFFPGILEQLPPNTHGLVDIEEAQLVSIVGEEAVFKDDKGYRGVSVGGDVYLGQITEVDPRAERVVARLNKGGIVDEIELNLGTGERYRQALGPATLTPTEQ